MSVQHFGQIVFYKIIIGVHDHQTVVGADVEPVVIDTGSVGHGIIHSVDPVNIGKDTGCDLHHTLTGGGKPEIAFIVLHDILNGTAHLIRIDLCIFFGFEIQPADAVPCADPEKIILEIKSVHAGKILCHIGGITGKSLCDISVVDVGIIVSQIEKAGMRRIRIQTVDVSLKGHVLGSVEIGHTVIVYQKDLAVVGDAVDISVGSGIQVIDIFAIQGGIRKPLHGEVFIYIDKPVGGADQNLSLRGLRNGADGGRQKTVVHMQKPKLAVKKQCQSVVIGADPEAVFGIYKERNHTGDAGGGFIAVKTVSVITYQSAVAADPDEAVTGLYHRICFGGGHPDAGIIEDRGLSDI